MDNMTLSRVPGPDNIYVGGIWTVQMESQRTKMLEEHGVTHVLSALKFSLDEAKWSEAHKVQTQHMTIDVDDMEDVEMLCHLPAAVRFIDEAVRGSRSDEGSGEKKEDQEDEKKKTGGVYVHCAMGKSRSVTCVVAYLLWRYPHRFGGGGARGGSDDRRKENAHEVVNNAIKWVREGRPGAEPNVGFHRQLELWWEMGCPVEDGGDQSLERHPIYQRWLYDKMLLEARDAHMAPNVGDIRFEDEVGAEREGGSKTAGPTPQGVAAPAAADRPAGKEVRCKKCRRVLATPKFVVPHREGSATCAHIFVDTLSWMRPALEDGSLDGRLICPNSKCGASVGRFAWQGLSCTCREWVVPAFTLQRSRVDEVAPAAATAGLRMPPGRNGNL